MRNLIIFIRRYYLFFLFLFLEGIGFWMLVRNNNFQNAAFVNSTNFIASSIYSTFSGVTDYFKLNDINQKLLEENSRYRNGIISSFYNNGKIIAEQPDSNLLQQFTYIPASVINNSVNRRTNYLTLNRGSLHGIKKTMGVISPGGLVGIVVNVSDHFCSVQSLLNKNSRISAQIKENEYFGSLIWDGKDAEYATLVDINKHVEVKEGQTIITSAFSHIFPKGIPIGKIVKVGYDEGGNFYVLKIKLLTDFGSVSSVYVINNLMKDEIEKLEEKNKDDKEDINKTR